MRKNLVDLLGPVRGSVGPRPSARKGRGVYDVVGFDIESVNVGRVYPFALGIVTDEWERAFLLRPGDGLIHLARHLQARASGARSRERTVIAVAHNLVFDLGMLITDYRAAHGARWPKVDPDPAHVELDLPGIGRLDCYLGKPCFARLLLSTKQTVHFIDTWAYFTMSLDRAAAAIGLRARKLPTPPGLGSRTMPLSEVRPYVLRDAGIAQKLGRQITQWWIRDELRPAVSVPHMASLLFTHKYLSRPWVGLSPSIERLSLLAYHGGKNGFYTSPGWHDVHSYDIRSAYTWAMTKLPDMARGEWRSAVTPPKGAWGFCAVTGTMPSTARYPFIYKDDDTKLQAGESFKQVVMTTLEYDLLRELFPRWRPAAMTSFYWKSDAAGLSDLARFALESSKARASAPSAEENLRLKLVTNSLYGKFIQRTQVYDVDAHAWTVKRGAMFYPPIAAWITALVRCRVTRYEYAHGAIHTSTDGFLVTERLPKRALSTGLGGLGLDAKGHALILRNKVYFLFDARGRCLKFVRHAIHVDAPTFWAGLRSGQTYYTADRMRQWTEAANAGALPYEWITETSHVEIPDLDVIREAANDPPFRRAHFKPGG